MDNALEKKSFKKELKESLDLFLVFIKVGFLAFGGGLAILRVLEQELCEKRNYLSKEEMLDYYILSQLIPGIIIVSSSCFIGYKVKKQRGIFIALLGVIIPSIAVIVVVALLLDKLIAYKITTSILKGMSVAVTAVLIDINIDLIKNNVNNIVYFIVFVLSFISMRFFNVSIVFIVLASIMIGLFYKEKEIRNEVLKDKNIENNKDNNNVKEDK